MYNKETSKYREKIHIHLKMTVTYSNNILVFFNIPENNSCKHITETRVKTQQQL
jgi:hypothetical protein